MNKKIVAIGCLLPITLFSVEGEPAGLMPLGPTTSSTGMVFPEGKSRAVFKSLFLTKEKFYKGSSETDQASSVNADRKVTSQVHQLTLRHGIGGGWDARVVIPYLSKMQELNHPDSQRREWSNSGFGDITVIARKSLLNQKKGDPVFLAAGFGIKLPTGDTNEEFTKYYPETAGGAYTSNQPFGLQLGSGSWDPMVELGITRFLPASRVDFYTNYRLTTEGDNDHEFGDVMNYSFAYAHAMSDVVDLGIGINGWVKGKDKLDGEERDNTGGHVMYASPDLHFKFQKKLDLSVAYSIPIIKNVNGDSGGSGKTAYPEGQGVEDGRLMIRLGYNF